VPLTLAAAVGALIFGQVEFGLTVSIVLGSVPAVLVGALLSSRAPDRYIRPVITFAIFASGLKYAGVPTMALGWVLLVTLVLGVAGWLALARPWRGYRPATEALDGSGTREARQQPVTVMEGQGRDG
jgi:uncharacterized protein